MFIKIYGLVTDNVVVVATTTVTTTSGQQRAQTVTYHEFDITHLRNCNGGMNWIVDIRWIIDVKSAITMSFSPHELNVNFALNHLTQGVEDWWVMVCKTLSPYERYVMTWDKFTNMLKVEYVLLLEREHLAQEYLSLKQAT